MAFFQHRVAIGSVPATRVQLRVTVNEIRFMLHRKDSFCTGREQVFKKE